MYSFFFGVGVGVGVVVACDVGSLVDFVTEKGERSLIGRDDMILDIRIYSLYENTGNSGSYLCFRPGRGNLWLSRCCCCRCCR